MQVRDRIKELRRVPAAQLRPNARNWRTHPEHQRDALRGILAEVGYAGALLARELPDGSLELIDGHLRAETTPEALVPVLVLDVTEEESLKLLATFDPLGGLAETNQAALDRVLSHVETESDALRHLLADLAEASNVRRQGETDLSDQQLALELFQVVVECQNEDQQRRVFEQISAQGLKCRLLNL
jgi:ParB-like nuclease family protein